MRTLLLYPATTKSDFEKKEEQDLAKKNVMNFALVSCHSFLGYSFHPGGMDRLTPGTDRGIGNKILRDIAKIVKKAGNSFAMGKPFVDVLLDAEQDIIKSIPGWSRNELM